MSKEQGHFWTKLILSMSKAEIMVDHFHEQVLALNKIGGQARAMVVASGIERAIQYYQAVSAYPVERKNSLSRDPWREIAAIKEKCNPSRLQGRDDVCGMAPVRARVTNKNVKRFIPHGNVLANQ